MKKLLCILLLLSLLVTCIPMGAGAEATLTVTPSKSAYKAGETITIKATMTGIKNCNFIIYKEYDNWPGEWDSDYWPGTETYTSDTATSYEFTLDLGTYYAYVSAQDAENNWHYEKSVIFTVGPSGKSVKAPTSVAIKAGTYDVLDSVECTIESTEDLANYYQIRYILFKNDKKVQESTMYKYNYSEYSAGKYTYKPWVSFSSWGPGTYHITASLEDNEGNKSTEVASNKITVSAAALLAPKITVIGEAIKDSEEKKLYANEPITVRFERNTKQMGNWINDDYVEVHYTVTDASGADVSCMPKLNAYTRSTSFGQEVEITKGVPAGTYTIKAMLHSTADWYTDSAESTLTVTVSAETRPEKKKGTASIEITNGIEEEVKSGSINKTGEYTSSTYSYEHVFRPGEKLTATITVPGASKCVVLYGKQKKEIALTNGTGTFESDPLTYEETYGNTTIKVISADDKALEYNDQPEAYYYVRIAQPTISTDKAYYAVGDTAKITVSGSGAEYFSVYSEHREKKEDVKKEGFIDTQYSTRYSAASGSVTLEIPVTEAGWLYIAACSIDPSGTGSFWPELYIQIDTPENIQYTGEKERTVEATELLAPTGLKVLPGDNGGLIASWVAAAGASGYQVFRADGTPSLFTLIAETTETSYTDLTVPSKKVVYYRVVSMHKTADGRQEVVGAVEDAPFTSYMLLPKLKLKVNVKTAKTLSMSWKKAKEADYYEVYYNTKKTAPTATTKATLTVKDGVKVDATKKVKGGKTYYCYVRAVKQLSDGTKAVGPWSKVVKKKAKK